MKSNLLYLIRNNNQRRKNNKHLIIFRSLIVKCLLKQKLDNKLKEVRTTQKKLDYNHFIKCDWYAGSLINFDKSLSEELNPQKLSKLKILQYFDHNFDYNIIYQFTRFKKF